MPGPGGVAGPGGGMVPGPGGGGGGIPACTEADPPALWTESQMPVKHYLGPTSLQPVNMTTSTYYRPSAKLREGNVFTGVCLFQGW